MWQPVSCASASCARRRPVAVDAATALHTFAKNPAATILLKAVYSISESHFLVLLQT